MEIYTKNKAIILLINLQRIWLGGFSVLTIRKIDLSSHLANVFEATQQGAFRPFLKFNFRKLYCHNNCNVSCYSGMKL